eukprot:COSAG02_NODE_5559_length_4229_cov_143.642373_6_plen_32_part_00
MELPDGVEAIPTAQIEPVEGNEGIASPRPIE